MGEQLFSPQDIEKIRRVSSQLEPTVLFLEYLEGFVNFRDHIRKAKWKDPTTIALYQELDQLASELKPKKKSARKHAHDRKRQVEQQLTIVRKLIMERLTREGASPKQAIRELRGVIDEPTLEKVS